LCGLLAPLAVQAGGVQDDPATQLDPVQVVAIPPASSAAEGRITEEQLRLRPLSRPAEVLEAVPGLIVTQHSGEGKANQYFLRGFNLDHGTDLATTVAGVPVNLPTNAHGHGYTDLNFLIPELVSSVRYKKGPYFADEGDFSAAGAVNIDLVTRLDAPFFKLTAGQGNYRKGLVAGSLPLGVGDLLLAAQSASNNGPWTVPERFRADSLLLRYSGQFGGLGLDLLACVYRARWTSTDQVAQRAIDDGVAIIQGGPSTPFGRFDSLNPTDGGQTRRNTLSASVNGSHASLGEWRVQAYTFQYMLKLFSDFTYFLDRPLQGDQFEQAERRTVTGLDARSQRQFSLWGTPLELAVGLQVRHDRIDPIGLYHTVARVRTDTVRQDAVQQTQTGMWLQARWRISEHWRAVLGLRHDREQSSVTSDNPQNSGRTSASLTSPKAALIYRLPLDAQRSATLFANVGRGFHSNDARGALTRVDPASGQAVEPVTLLVPARGSELGARYVDRSLGLQSSISLWRLSIASELLFVGDAGTTEPNRPSRRNGIEWATYWQPDPRWIIDFDLAASRGRFTDADPAGPYIPDSIQRTVSAGIGYRKDGWDAGLRLRYFGPRPLIEDNSVRSAPSTLVNAQVGWQLQRQLRLELEVLNLFDRKVNDIEYFYASRLPDEAAPVDDRHVHPSLPRTIRLALQWHL
jgi:outer membrane receptor protein involved in Fe transport